MESTISTADLKAKLDRKDPAKIRFLTTPPGLSRTILQLTRPTTAFIDLPLGELQACSIQPRKERRSTL
jgi:hypothetical protein